MSSYGFDNIGRSHGGKKGGNKGIARARKEQRRIEAEARNALTPPERRRKNRLSSGR